MITTRFLCIGGKNRRLSDGLHQLAATVKNGQGTAWSLVDPLHKMSFHQIPSLLKGDML